MRGRWLQALWLYRYYESKYVEIACVKHIIYSTLYGKLKCLCLNIIVGVS